MQRLRQLCLYRLCLPPTSSVDLLGSQTQSNLESCLAETCILIISWPNIHGDAEAASFLNGHSRAEARQSRRLETHTACAARRRRLRELCCDQAIMQ